jgi:hypothetical protein
VTRLLGGEAGPIGWYVQYLDTPFDTVLDALRRFHRGLGHRITIAEPRLYPDVLTGLLPFEAPWTRELLLPCGSWTAYLNNFVNGGDPSAYGPALRDVLGGRHITAMHSPRHGPGHGGTQLWEQGPDGRERACERTDERRGGWVGRTISAVATDGRWRWDASGTPFPFEDLDRYTARRIRDRLDRPLLLRYLTELGIPAADDAYGPGVLVTRRMWGRRRTVSLAEMRAELAVDH